MSTRRGFLAFLCGLPLVRLFGQKKDDGLYDEGVCINARVLDEYLEEKLDPAVRQRLFLREFRRRGVIYGRDKR